MSHQHASLEETFAFTPKFGADGLLTAIAVNEKGEPLMVAHMNKEALDKTLATKQVHYYSRSRQSLWLKGETSGQIQTLLEMRVDCDQDALWLTVRVGGDGGACHTGRNSCFYRRVINGQLELL
jgi:phosphoribosyl-AMP cyclohydrolase